MYFFFLLSCFFDGNHGNEPGMMFKKDFSNIDRNEKQRETFNFEPRCVRFLFDRKVRSFTFIYCIFILRIQMKIESNNNNNNINIK